METAKTQLVDAIIAASKQINYTHIAREDLKEHFGMPEIKSTDSLSEILPDIQAEIRRSGVILMENASRFREQLPEIVEFLSGKAASSFEGNASKSLRSKFSPGAKKIYNTTQLYKQIVLLQHNENSYHNRYPSYIAFLCHTPGEEENGATPITKNTEVVPLLPDAVLSGLKDGFVFKRYLPSSENKTIRSIQEFIRKHQLQTLLPVSTWQSVFNVDNIEALKTKIVKNTGAVTIAQDKHQGIIYTVKKTPEDPVFLSPLNLYRFCGDTCEAVKKNLEALLFEDMEPTAALVEEIEKLSTYNLTVGWTFFEGEQDIPETYKSAVKEAIVKATKRFSWKKGDLMIIDNKQVMHGRENYNNENRKIAVSFS